MPPRRILPSERSPADPAPLPVPVGPKVPLMARIAATYVGVLGFGYLIAAVIWAVSAVTAPDVPVWSFHDGSFGVLASAAAALAFAGGTGLVVVASTGLVLGRRQGWLAAVAVVGADLALSRVDAVVSGGRVHYGPGVIALVLLLWPSVVRYMWRPRG